MGKPRAARALTPARLERAALFYLERYSASAESLRRVLLRRVARAAKQEAAAHEPVDDGSLPGAALVEAVIARLIDEGLLDDARYAEGRVRTLLRRGMQPARARRYLAERGVEAEIVEAALAGLAEESGADEAGLARAAAIAYARRRRLGPFRAAARRAEFRLRDLAAMGRAGFAFELARAVIDAAPDEA